MAPVIALERQTFKEVRDSGFWDPLVLSLVLNVSLTLISAEFFFKQSSLFQQSTINIEKEPFSVEELLCKIIEDSHSSKDLLSHALPVFQEMV